jgi:hypothetical protein
MSNLEVHHDDSDANLITLCNDCHAALHDS